jgi:hypothetical protein
MSRPYIPHVFIQGERHPFAPYFLYCIYFSYFFYSVFTLPAGWVARPQECFDHFHLWPGSWAHAVRSASGC